MRTTVTLDEDVLRELNKYIKKEDKSFKQALNEVLKIGLNMLKAPKNKNANYKVMSFKCGNFKPGIDPLRLNQLFDELEEQDFIEESLRKEKL